MKKIFVLFLLPLPLLAAAPADFAAIRPILGTHLDAPRLVEVRLDAAIMAATQPGFSDLRLFDTAGREIPRSIEPLFTTKERTERQTVPAKATDLREIPGNRIEARFAIEPGAPSPSFLEIHTPLRNFIRTIRVSGSDDGQDWRPLADAEIVDYSRYMDIRRTEIPLSSNSCRHFSVEISNASEERAKPLVRLVQKTGGDASRALDLLQTPFRIDGVSFWSETTVIDKDKTVTQEWPHSGLADAQDAKAKTTEITLDTRRAPVTRLQIETPARNFQRSATIQVPALRNGQKIWRPIGNGRFTRIDVSGLATNVLGTDFPEQRAEQLRLVIQNADNPPLDITGVRPSGPVYRLLWLAEPAATYRLAYGNEQLSAPAYDLFAIRAALENGIAPDLWRLAAPDENHAAKKSFRPGDFLARPAVFGSSLALAALALLFLLARALKKAPQ